MSSFRRPRGDRPRDPAGPWVLSLAVLLAGPGAMLGVGSAVARPAAGPPGGPDLSMGPPPRPPGLGPILAAGASYSGHYYAGGYYSGPSTNTTELSADIAIPQDVPEAGGSFYYVLLSTWDNAASYDQVGFTNSNGTWGLTESTTGPCASSYFTRADAMRLNPGTVYRFAMRLVLGDVEFTVAPAGGAVVYNYSADTGATEFAVAPSYTCDGSTYEALTDYEEVYDTSGPVPPYSFPFTNTTAAGGATVNWTSDLAGAPASVRVAIDGPNLTVENVPFSLAANATLLTEAGADPVAFSEAIDVAEIAPAGTLEFALSGKVPGGSVAISPASGSAPFSANLSVNLTSALGAATVDPIEVELRDASGVYARIRVEVVVEPTLSASAPSPSRPDVDVGIPVLLTEDATGGSGLYAYDWQGLPAGCLGSTAVVQCIPTGTGTYLVNVTVTDSLGITAVSSDLGLTVYADLAVNLTENRSSLDVGESVLLTAEVTGGSPGASTSWSSAEAAGCSHRGASLVCAPSAPGEFGIGFTVVDFGGGEASAATTLVVLSAPELNATANPAVVEIGHAVLLSIEPSGGSGGYVAVWTGLPATCLAASMENFSCLLDAPATIHVSVQVTDSNGGTSPLRNLTVRAVAPPTVSFGTDLAEATAGASFALAATVGGGAPPYRYAWSGLPPGCSGGDASTLSCVPSSAGTFVVEVNVTDSLSGSSHASVSVHVNPANPLPDRVLEYGGVLVAGLAAFAGVMIWRRRRRRGRTASPLEESAGSSRSA